MVAVDLLATDVGNTVARRATATFELILDKLGMTIFNGVRHAAQNPA